jgi:hypothetical protein
MKNKFWNNRSAELCKEFCLQGKKLETMF